MLAVAGGVAVKLSTEEWRWIIAAIALVLIAELVNTAIEHLGDAVTLEHSEHIRRAKDIGSGAVLAAVIAAFAIGVSIFAPHVFRR